MDEKPKAMFSLKINVLFWLCMLAGCAVRPVFKTPASLKHVYIARIEDKEGHFLRIFLRRRFFPSGPEALWTCTVTLEHLKEGDGINLDGTWAGVRLATVARYDLSNGQKRFSGSVRTQHAYPLHDNRFLSSTQTEWTFRTRAMEDLAFSLATRIAEDFNA